MRSSEENSEGIFLASIQRDMIKRFYTKILLQLSKLLKLKYLIILVRFKGKKEA